MGSTLMTVQRIVPNLATADSAAGRDFYERVLGLEVAMDLGWIVTLTAPGTPGAQLSLIRADPSGLHPDYSVGVDDVEACHARAVAAGISILYPLTREPWGVRRFFVRDPNGRIANIVSHA
jgi:catechol 2,3-dioxygenase-like lactoylglutathione lyase family enzyme